MMHVISSPNFLNKYNIFAIAAVQRISIGKCNDNILCFISIMFITQTVGIDRQPFELYCIVLFRNLII